MLAEFLRKSLLQHREHESLSARIPLTRLAFGDSPSPRKRGEGLQELPAFSPHGGEGGPIRLWRRGPDEEGASIFVVLLCQPPWHVQLPEGEEG